MNENWKTCLLAVALLAVSGCSAQPAAPPSAATATPMPTLVYEPTRTPPFVQPTQRPTPAPGEWTSSAEFGRFTFTVNPDGTAITAVSYEFEDWTCGTTTQSGTIGVSGFSSMIAEGRFTLESDLGAPPGSLAITVEGSFDTGLHATGTWTADSHGTVCSGTWEASPS